MASVALIKDLINDLDEIDYELRQQSRTQLLRIGEETIDYLIEAAYTDTQRKCWEAASILSEYDDPRLGKVFEDGLKSSSTMMSQVCAAALEKYGDIQAYINALPHCKSMTQTQIIEVLGRIGDRRAVAALIKVVQETEHNHVRYTAIEALGNIGDSTVISELEEYLDHENHHVRSRTESALRQLGA